MQKEYLYGIIGLLAGSLITIFLASNAVNSNNTGMMRMMGIRNQEQLRCPMTQEPFQDQDSQGVGIR